MEQQGYKHWKFFRFLEILVHTENVEGNFLMLEEFQDKFKIKTNFFYYLEVIAAIPSDLRKKAATIEIPSQEVLNTAKLSSSAIATPDLSEMRHKNYYNCLLYTSPSPRDA